MSTGIWKRSTTLTPFARLRRSASQIPYRGIYLRSFLIFLAAAGLAGCGYHSRFGHDPDIVYPTDHFKTPVLSLGRYGGSFTFSLPGDPKTFNTWISDDNYSSYIGTALYDSLETRDSFTLKFVPRLAFLPKVTDGGRIYTYTLRPGLKWSDGAPITADDVLFTVRVLFDPSIQGLYRETMLIDAPQPGGGTKREPFQYRKIDSRTVQFTLPGPWAPAEQVFSFPIMPEHALGKAYQSGQFNSAWSVATRSSQLVASGPFIMSDYVPGQRVVLKPNPHFWRRDALGRPLPYLDSVRLLIAPDQNSQVLAFRSGGADDLLVPPRQYPELARYARRDNYTVINAGPGWSYQYLVLNFNPHSKCGANLVSLFSRKEFRQAVSYAIDRNRICRDVFLGLADPDYNPQTRADLQYYDPKVRQYPFDPGKARVMLAALGLKPMPGGTFWWKGAPVSFTIMTDTENDPDRNATTVITNDLRNIGLDVIETPMTFDEVVRRADDAPYDWQGCVLNYSLDPEPNDGSAIYRSTGEDHQWWPRQKSPATAWEARIDQDFSRGARTLDFARRRARYNDYQEIMGEQEPMMFLDCVQQISAVRNHYGNIEPSQIYDPGGGVVWNIEDLYDTHAVRTTR